MAKLGDTVIIYKPRPLTGNIEQSFRESLEEMAWRNNPTAFPMPEHVKSERQEIVLTTQAMVDEYNATEAA